MRWRASCSDLSRGDERIAELERELAAARAAFLAAAEKLSKERRRIAKVFAKELEALVAELAMERTRFEVRFGEAPLPESAWSGARHRRRRVLRLAEPRRGSPAAGPHRFRRRAVAHHARDQDADRDHPARLQRRHRSAAERVGARADLRRGRRRHRRPRRRRRRPQAADAGLGVSGAVHHAPAADRRLRGHALRDREAGRAAAGRGPRSAGSTADGRVEELARMLGGEAISDGLRQSAREMLAERSKAAGRDRPLRGGARRACDRRKAKAKGERRKS